MEPPSRHLLEFSPSRAYSGPLQPLQRAFAHALERHDAAPGTAGLLLGTDEEIRLLNRRFRGIDSPTDVLTFPDGEDGRWGEIAIAVPYASRQAVLRGVSLDQELAYLVLHGALHLLGWDDETDEERDSMLQEMNRLARELSLPEDPNWGSILHEQEVPV